MADAAGYRLLVISDCRIDSAGATYTGTLALECITVAPDAGNSSGERDIWLVIRLGAFEIAVSPVQPILHDRQHGVWTIPGHPASVLRLPIAPPNSSLAADLETFEVLLAQYGVVHEQGGGAPAGLGEKSGDGPMKGRLVLVDETDGHIVGEIGEQFAVREDPSFHRPGHEKDPVIVELPEPGQTPEIRVHAVRPEERDSIMRGAHMLSRGLIMATDVVSTGLNMASNKFVSSTKPNETPVTFSEPTRKNIRRGHKLTCTAVKVTAATTATIFKTVDYVARYLGGGSRAPSPVPPPLPSRDKAATLAAPQPYGGYSPYHTPSSSRGPSPGPYQQPPPTYQQLPPKATTALTTLDTRAAPTLPPRSGSRPSSPYGLLSPTPMSPVPAGPPPPPAKKPRMHNRLLMATDLILTTVEESAKQLVTDGTAALSTSMGHRYGQDVGDAVQMGGDSIRNVGMVYIDAKGVGRRALLKRAGKGMLKAKFGSNKQVVFPAAEAPALPSRNSRA